MKKGYKRYSKYEGENKQKGQDRKSKGSVERNGTNRFPGMCSKNNES